MTDWSSTNAYSKAPWARWMASLDEDLPHRIDVRLTDGGETVSMNPHTAMRLAGQLEAASSIAGHVLAGDENNPQADLAPIRARLDNRIFAKAEEDIEALLAAVDSSHAEAERLLALLGAAVAYIQELELVAQAACDRVDSHRTSSGFVEANDAEYHAVDHFRREPSGGVIDRKGVIMPELIERAHEIAARMRIDSDCMVTCGECRRRMSVCSHLAQTSYVLRDLEMFAGVDPPSRRYVYFAARRITEQIKPEVHIEDGQIVVKLSIPGARKPGCGT